MRQPLHHSRSFLKAQELNSGHINLLLMLVLQLESAQLLVEGAARVVALQLQAQV